MARSALMVSLQRAYKIARASLKTGIPTDEIVDILKDIAYDIEYTKLKYFWTLSYKLKKE